MAQEKAKPSVPTPEQPLRFMAPCGALAVVMLAVFWRVLDFPFIQDDWGWLYRFQTERPAAVLAYIFNVKGVLFYRPLAELYMYLMYRVFGVDPIPFHVVALLLHFGASCLVAAIVKRLLRDGVIAWAAAFIYALAVAVVFESLLWAVGIFDLGAVFFFLLSIYLFLRKRTVASAIVFLVGCLFKETVIVLPAVLFAYTMIADSPERGSRLARARAELLPMAGALCAIIVVKLMGKAPYSLPLSDPYAVRFTGNHVWILITKYAFCLFQSFYPYGAMKSSAFAIALSGTGVLLAIGGWLSSRAPRDAASGRVYLFFLLWCVVALLPPIFLPNHGYRYYAIYALPAFIALALAALGLLAAAFGLGRRPVQAIMVAVAVLAVILSSARAHRMLRDGLAWNTLIEGSNNLIRKAALVDVVHEGLKKYLPNPPSGSVIVLGNIDVWAFNKDSGPRVWYGDTTLSVYPIDDLKVDSVGTFIDAPIESQRRFFAGARGERRRVDVERLFGFMLEESRLRPVKFRGLSRNAASSGARDSTSGRAR